MTKILSDIVGPGITIGYIALAFSTLLIMIKPSSFNGVGNGMASITMALGYSVSSVIQTERTKQRIDDEMNPQNLAYAICMTSIALAFASVSILSRGRIARRIRGVKIDHTVHQNLAAIEYRKIHGLYMMFFMLAEITCVLLSIYSTAQLQKIYTSSSSFKIVIDVFLVIQASFVLYSAVAALNFRLQCHRWCTAACASIPFGSSLGFMIWGWVKGGVGINFGDWSYGQTFNGAAGIAGFATTLVDWLTSEDSAVDV